MKTQKMRRRMRKVQARWSGNVWKRKMSERSGAEWVRTVLKLGTK